MVARYVLLKRPRHHPLPIEWTEVWGGGNKVAVRRGWRFESNLNRCLMEPVHVLHICILSATSPLRSLVAVSTSTRSRSQMPGSLSILDLHFATVIACPGARVTTRLSTVTWPRFHTQRHYRRVNQSQHCETNLGIDQLLLVLKLM
jgi:hypothetical protein